MTNPRREFLRTAGKVAVIAAVSSGVAASSAQAIEPDLRNQLEAVIYDLRNPPPYITWRSTYLDDLKTANRLAEIIGVPVKAHGAYMDERLVHALETEKARRKDIPVTIWRS